MLQRQMLKRLRSGSERLVEPTSWSRFATLFLTTFAGGIVLVYLFIVLVDPYDMVPFSLPLERPIFSIAQRSKGHGFQSALAGRSQPCHARLALPCGSACGGFGHR